MSKRKLTRRQAWRIQKIQDERTSRADKREDKTLEQLNHNELGTEQQGLVIAHYGTLVNVEAIDGDNKGKVTRCHLRANLGSLVTGDRVVWRDGEPNGVIVAVLDRESELSRPDPYGDMKTIAANIDRIIIVISAYPEPHANLIDRYLVAAENLGIRPIILLNKADRIDDDIRPKLDDLKACYKPLDYEWLDVSCETEAGMDELLSYLGDHTSIFVGQSGVGKSSLINMLLPDLNLKVGGLTESTQQGTHTTTTAELFHFPLGGDLIDSPGIREFGLWHMDADDLLYGFREFQPFLGHCKFRNCAHESEPGCAIQQALEDGDISEKRMASYRYILQTINER